MKCHYINHKTEGRILIPGCIGVAVSNDMDNCTCNSTHKGMEERVSKLEEEVKLLKKDKS